MQIGELSRRAGCSVDAVRLYERLGLLGSARRANGYRDFPDAALELLRYILRAKSLGFTLAEIAEAQPGILSAENPTDPLAALFTAKAQLIESRIRGLQKLRRDLLSRAATVCPLGESPPGS
ncbi:MAG: MerR family transcriptional regulator [Phenylobacterium sp.]